MANGDTTIELPEIEVTPTPDASAPGGGGTGPLGTSTADGGSITGAPWSRSQYFDQVPYPPYLGNCVVYIDGQEYFEWESVSVKLSSHGKPRASCRLTVSEQEPWPENFAFLRIMPPDKCAVYLDGFQVFRGLVVTRQVYYDANQHTVEIQCLGWSEILDHGAFVSKTGEFKGQDGLSIIRAAAAPYGVGVQTEGDIPKDKFPRFSVQPGERAGEGIEKIARQLGVWLSSNPSGELVLLGKGAFAWVGDDLVEGVNIRTGHEIIHSFVAAATSMSTSQKGGNDSEWGAAITHQLQSEEKGGQFSPEFMPQRVLSELPSAGVDMLKKRAGMEKDANDQDQIWVTITHLGWLRPSNDSLWIPGQTVIIDAPMLVLHNHKLTLRTVTFSRDNQQGTIATLECSNQAAFSQEAGPDKGNGGGSA